MDVWKTLLENFFRVSSQCNTSKNIDYRNHKKDKALLRDKKQKPDSGEEDDEELSALSLGFRDGSSSLGDVEEEEIEKKRSGLRSRFRDLSPTRRSPITSPILKRSKKTKSQQLRSPTGSWLPASFNQMFQNYKSKAGDFKRLFKSLPDTEKLIVDYSCALQRDILVHGRFYLSQNWLCFYANIFGWETFVTIRCTEITSVTKEKTAKVIPNAIQICTKSEKYFFTSFVSRDNVYTMLFRIWQNALLDQQLSPQELIQMVGKYSHVIQYSDNESEMEKGSYEKMSNGELLSDGDESDIESEGVYSKQSNSEGSHDSIPQACTNEQIECPQVSVTPPSPQVAGEKPEFDLPTVEAQADQTEVVTFDGEAFDNKENCKLVPEKQPVKVKVPRKHRSHKGHEGTPKRHKKEKRKVEIEESSDVDDQVKEPDVVPAVCFCKNHLANEYLNEEYPVDVDTMFEYLFTESDFYKRIQKARNTYDLVFHPWETGPDSQQYRTIMYTIALNFTIGPKSTITTEKQKLATESIPGQVYVIECEVYNEGIPYSDSFTVLNKYCITRCSSKSCRLRISSDIFYKKSVWGLVKNMIEKNAGEGVKDYVKYLGMSLRKETAGKDRRHKRNISPTRARSKVDVEEPIAEPTIEPGQASGEEGDLSSSVSSSRWSLFTKAQNLRLPEIPVENKFSVIITTLLCLLFLMNVFLLYRLLSLEEATQSLWPSGFTLPKQLRDLPADSVEWQHLLKQQYYLHQLEMKRWHEVLSTSVNLMTQVQKSLLLLQGELGKSGSSIFNDKDYKDLGDLLSCKHSDPRQCLKQKS